jgi:hypothetical protein
MLALAAAPPVVADTTPDVPSAVVEGGVPISGPVPLPRHRPRVSLAVVTGVVPMPPPRPAEAAPIPPPYIPTFDRHAVE